MKRYHNYIRYGLLVLTAAVLLGSCSDGGYETNSDDLSIPLSVPGQEIKAPGKGQYRLVKKLVEDSVVISANLASFEPIKSFTITKKVNLADDSSFGTNGVITVDPASIDKAYDFTYHLSEADLDRLVGLTFRVESEDGRVSESDLTVVVTLTPRENLTIRKWQWKSKIWVDGGNVPDIKECEKDNYYLFNADSTMSLNFGDNTGSAGCDFDGFNVYYKWYLAEDEKTFVMKYYSIFSPDNIQTETYRVKTLTTDELELEIDYDLSIFGLGTEETYLFEFTPVPK